MDRCYCHFQVIEEIGRGGQGVVYRAVPNVQRWLARINEAIAEQTSQPGLNTIREVGEGIVKLVGDRIPLRSPDQVALKVLHPILSGHEKAKRRLRDEIRVLSQISHPHLIQLVDHDQQNGWVAFEYYENGTLDKHFERFKGNPLEALRVFLPVVDAVRKLHKESIVHRDIKPANIFLDNNWCLVLGDFGLVYDLGDSDQRVTSFSERVGTIDYMPLWVHGGRVDDVPRSFDVFSLAKILWTLIAGDGGLPMHFYNKPAYNLVERFPDQRAAMELVNEVVLRHCLVEDESACLPDGGELYRKSKELLQKLEHLEIRPSVVDNLADRSAHIDSRIRHSDIPAEATASPKRPHKAITVPKQGDAIDDVPPLYNRAQHRSGLQWRVFEVFLQQSRGEPHVHVGSIHAPDPEAALILAKEQYGRRQAAVNFLVFPADAITATDYNAVDLVEHGTDRTHREPYGYETTNRVRVETTKRPRVLRI